MKEKMKPVYCLAILKPDGQVFVDSKVKTESELSSLMQGIEGARIVKVKVEENAKRSIPASALFHVWAQQLSGFTGNDVRSQKAELKIQFGYPILRLNQELWPRLKKLFIGAQWHNLSYEEKIEMSELIPCTSIMSTKELKQMMDEIKAWAINQFGIELTNNWRGSNG